MGTNIQDVYICQLERTEELNRRNYQRNLASQQMTPKYFSRAISHRRTVMPTMDMRKNNVKKGIFRDYNMLRDFHPGKGGPYQAYSSSVDTESALFNRFNPLQKCAQNVFIPGSKSDLYKVMGPTPKAEVMPFALLQEKQIHPPFNPDTCNTSTDLFFNHTRQQIKDVKI